MDKIKIEEQVTEGMVEDAEMHYNSIKSYGFEQSLNAWLDYLLLRERHKQQNLSKYKKQGFE